MYLKKITLVLLLIVFIITSCTPKSIDNASRENENSSLEQTNEGAISKQDDNETQENIDKNTEATEENSSNKEIDIYNYEEVITKPIELVITEQPLPDRQFKKRGTLPSLPKYDPSNTMAFQVDLRGYDLSNLDIQEDSLGALMGASFNTSTKWPEQIPEGFNPTEIIEISKDPGLNVRELHSIGITGKGVGIAIIDQKLLVDHVEYKDQLKFYEEINMSQGVAHMHGSTVASIAVGKTVGVAPEADLYYIAETHAMFNNGEWILDHTWLAMSIDRILEVNKTLPEDEKIRVISISAGWLPEHKGYDKVTEAVERAKEQGVFIVSSSVYYTHGLYFHGLGRDCYDEPNDFNSYKPGSWSEKAFYEEKYKEYEPMLLVPMDATATASPSGQEEYVYYPIGGWSWSIPYIAGLYALACQVKPEVTPEEFWQTALDTGDTVKLEKEGKTYKLEKIVNPVKLIERLQQNN